MKDSTGQEIADLLIALSEKQDWDHKTWKRCHELIQANLNEEVLNSFYQDFLTYPGIYNIRAFDYSGPLRVVQTGGSCTMQLASEQSKTLLSLEFTEKNTDFQMKARINRNDPCPCGSGRKFKKCCGVPDWGQPTAGVRVPKPSAPAPKTSSAEAEPPQE